MLPTIWIYGGVHNDPGSRQKFLQEFAKQGTAPHFVAVEWEKSVFEHLAAWRPWIAEGLRPRWDFLTREDCDELSLALAWEGDAYANRFQNTEPLWLETGFQEADIKQRHGMDACKFAEVCACRLLEDLLNPCSPTTKEFMANIDAPSEPKSKKELIDRLWNTAWSEAFDGSGGFERDARWAVAIHERVTGLRDGWIAIVVGWTHLAPATGNQRLRDLLLSKGFSINSVRLAP